MICSTINRNPKSWLLAIVGAEHVMRWLPKGTHDWSKFITPDELAALLARRRPRSRSTRKGFVFNPLGWTLAPLRPRPLGQLRHRQHPPGRRSTGLRLP